MVVKEIILEGRKYKALVSPDEQNGAYIILGPPEGLVDTIGLPEPFATRLHNSLYDRGILSSKEASKQHRDVTGALQESLMIDAQRLMEEFFKYDKETV